MKFSDHVADDCTWIIYNEYTELRDYSVSRFFIGRPLLYFNIGVCDNYYMGKIYEMNMPYSMLLSKVI